MANWVGFTRKLISWRQLDSFSLNAYQSANWKAFISKLISLNVRADAGLTEVFFWLSHFTEVFGRYGFNDGNGRRGPDAPT